MSYRLKDFTLAVAQILISFKINVGFILQISIPAIIMGALLDGGTYSSLLGEHLPAGVKYSLLGGHCWLVANTPLY